MDSTVAVSAPGKVLLAGGYLVLDRGYTGLVFGLSARIHVIVQDLPICEGAALSEVIVRSPQFRDAEWRYSHREADEDGGGVEVNQLPGHPTDLQFRNKFVETALAYALTYVSTHAYLKIKPALITILADTDYYSSTEPLGSATSVSNQRFFDFKISLQDAHKTGLGSSAALVTAFVAAVLTYYLPNIVSMNSETGKAHVHNLSQAAHCAAQSKVGSGFDVAAAVYGSCLYKRFSPSVLENLGELGTKGFAIRLSSVVENLDPSKSWDMGIDKSRAVIPPGLRLLMCDVDCGSETVGMVKKVLSWKKENPAEADILWKTLQKGNEDLADELSSLAQPLGNASRRIENISTIFLTIRSLIREMSTKAKVPIEPEVQTELLNACCQISGVVGGVVPGAGGFDAIALLVEDRDDVYEALHDILQNYRVDADHCKGASIGRVSLLGVQQEIDGVKVEGVRIYDGWVS